MTLQTWREDEFEDQGHDDRMLAKYGSTSSIMEREVSSPFRGHQYADMVFVGPVGRLVALETKVSPPRKYENAVYLSSFLSLYGFEGKIIIDHRRMAELLNQAAIVWSQLSIDELSRNIDLMEGVSASYAKPIEHKETLELEAIHPLTGPVCSQLAEIPAPTKEAVQNILSKFANSVPYSATTKLPTLRLSVLEDSSYLLEWTFEDRRLGFSFEQNPKDSGWYFVLSTASSERYESGTMDQLEMSRLIKMMLKQ